MTYDEQICPNIYYIALLRQMLSAAASGYTGGV